MRTLIRLLQLSALPTFPDLALLLVRVWFGASMIALHGWGKLANYSTRAATFGDPLGVSPPVSLALAIIGEVVAPTLIIIGLGTRAAAAVSAFSISVAFFLVHGAALSGPRNGELAFMYLGAFLAILLAGPGRYSLDRSFGGR